MNLRHEIRDPSRLARIANYRDANGNYLGTGRSPSQVSRRGGQTLRNLPLPKPTTLRQIVPNRRRP